MDRSVEPVKTSLQRPIVIILERLGCLPRRHVPFAHGIATVVGRLQCLGNGCAVAIESSTITIVPAIFHHMSYTRLMWMQSCQQRCARGTTSRCVVELREPHTVLRESVQVRGFDFPAVTANVRETHVVAEDYDNVRFAGIGREHRRRTA